MTMTTMTMTTMMTMTMMMMMTMMMENAAAAADDDDASHNIIIGVRNGAFFQQFGGVLKYFALAVSNRRRKFEFEKRIEGRVL